MAGGIGVGVLLCMNEVNLVRLCTQKLVFFSPFIRDNQRRPNLYAPIRTL